MAEALGVHVSRGYIYFARGLSLFMEMLNLALRRGRKWVALGDGRETQPA
jgi:hypothetical protein